MGCISITLKLLLEMSEFVDKFWYLMKSGKDYIVSVCLIFKSSVGRRNSLDIQILKGCLMQYSIAPTVPKCYFHTQNGKKGTWNVITKFY